MNAEHYLHDYGTGKVGQYLLAANNLDWGKKTHTNLTLKIFELHESLGSLSKRYTSCRDKLRKHSLGLQQKGQKQELRRCEQQLQKLEQHLEESQEKCTSIVQSILQDLEEENIPKLDSAIKAFIQERFEARLCTRYNAQLKKETLPVSLDQLPRTEQHLQALANQLTFQENRHNLLVINPLSKKTLNSPFPLFIAGAYLKTNKTNNKLLN